VPVRVRLLLAVLLICPCYSMAVAQAPAHDQFRVAVYIPVGVVERMNDPAYLASSWEALSTQVKVDRFISRLIAAGRLLTMPCLKQ